MFTEKCNIYMFVNGKWLGMNLRIGQIELNFLPTFAVVQIRVLGLTLFLKLFSSYFIPVGRYRYPFIEPFSFKVAN